MAYRKRITVAGTTAGSQSDYQMRLTIRAGAGVDSGSVVYLGGHGKADFGDIRFTSDGLDGLLNYWVETKVDGDLAVVWIKLPSIPASPGSVDIYLHYGHNPATTLSNGQAVWEAYSELGEAFTPPLMPDNYLTLPSPYPLEHWVHPSVVDFGVGQSWNSYRYWMANTPYENSNDQTENPCVLASNDGITWVKPAGLTNPVVPVPPSAFNADVELVFNDTTNELYMYWRASDYLGCVKSSDGVNWTTWLGNPVVNGYSDPLPAPSGFSSWANTVSPCVIKEGNSWTLYCVDISTATYKLARFTSVDGINWGDKTLPTGVSWQPWHLGVEKCGEELVLVASDRSAPSPQKGGAFWLAKSSDDGATWSSSAIPLMYPDSSKDWADRNLYRPTLTSRGGVIDMWFSVHSSVGGWRTALTSFDLAAIWNRISTATQDGFGFTSLAGFNIGSRFIGGSVTREGRKALLVEQRTGTNAVARKTLAAARTTPARFMVFMKDYADVAGCDLAVLRLMDTAGTGRVGVGAYATASLSKYSKHNKTFAYTVGVTDRSIDWHKLELLFSNGVECLVDNVAQGAVITSGTSLTQVKTIDLATSDTEATNFIFRQVAFSDFCMGKYVSPEPVFSAVAAEEVSDFPGVELVDISHTASGGATSSGTASTIAEAAHTGSGQAAASGEAEIDGLPERVIRVPRWRTTQVPAKSRATRAGLADS